ncbi:MAG: hypothetical protein K0S61_83 [Anaerocolumna sp.]|jgi:hypothetical protein|nr:hypothetical protein [Anaerocolumna sp.]
MKWIGKKYELLTIGDATDAYEAGFEMVCGDGTVKSIHDRFDGFYSLMFGLDICRNQNYNKKEENK